MSGEGGLKHRGPNKKRSHQDLNGASPVAQNNNTPSKVAAKAKQEVKQTVGSQWDYKIAAVIITVLGFATRFYGITHPNSVVFDEVHFGKVSLIYYLCLLMRSL